MTTSPVASITDDELASIREYVKRQDKADNSAVCIDFRELRGLVAKLEEAEQDFDRIEWLDKQVEAYGFQDVHEGNRWVIDGPFSDLRRAIDICMEQQP